VPVAGGGRVEARYRAHRFDSVFDAAPGVVLCESSKCDLASAEGNDAPDRIVRGHANGHPISGHHFDSEAAHPAAQLGEHLVPLVALHSVKPTTVHGHNGALHVNQIILAQ
jgi:hypothetical protein